MFTILRVNSQLLTNSLKKEKYFYQSLSIDINNMFSVLTHSSLRVGSKFHKFFRAETHTRFFWVVSCLGSLCLLNYHLSSISQLSSTCVCVAALLTNGLRANTCKRREAKSEKEKWETSKSKKKKLRKKYFSALQSFILLFSLLSTSLWASV